MDVFGCHVDCVDCADRHVDHCVLSEAYFGKILTEAFFDVCELLSIPTDPVHFVHGHDQFVNPKGTNYICMFFGLPSSSERTLKVICIDHQDRVICLGCSSDHVRDEVAMTWRVQEDNMSVPYIYLLDAHIDRHSSCSFLFS